VSEHPAPPPSAARAGAVAPPVVAVMVVHRPREGLSEALASLAAQDYPAVQALVLVGGREEDPGSRAVLDTVANAAPAAVVRFLGANTGWAAACNTVLRLVKGDSGFFLFLHDDVALAPDAVTRLVEELYRSNAGVVGPKLVEWSDPRRIASVGVAVDRFGVEIPVADEGEIDQEQHDAVRDVFALSSACLLVRADLFRTVGGFHPRLALVGAALDFCWRCHATGGRVVVVPAAVVRHRAEWTRAESPELHAERIGLRETTRVQTVAAMTPAGAFTVLWAQMLLYTLVRSVVLVVTGRFGAARAEVAAVLAAPLARGDVSERRAHLAVHRIVPASEIRALQLQGSSHVATWLRRRSMRTALPDPTAAQKEATPRGSIALWAILVGLLLVGSRSLLLDGVAPVGQMVAFGESATDLVASYFSGWWGAGYGSAGSLPTGTGLVGAVGLLFGGRMGLLHTLSVVALPLAGWIGTWRFASVLASRASRIAATATYAAVPLPYAAIAAGRWGALLVYALLPWMVHLMRLLVGHIDANDSLARGDEDVFFEISPRVRGRWFASLALVSAIGLAFEPGLLIVAGGLVFAWFVVTLAHGATPARAVRWVTVGVGAMVAGVVLNLPWAAAYPGDLWWEKLTGAPVEGGREWGFMRIASFGVGGYLLPLVSLALYVSVLGAVTLVRGAKTPWALRGAVLVVAGLLAVVLDDVQLLPFHLPEPAVMLVPVAFGLATCAGAMGATFVGDMRRGRFSWKQPLGALLSLVFVAGLAAAPLNAWDGGWRQPTFSLTTLLRQLPDQEDAGGYRTLFVGDGRVLPGAPLYFGWGISFSVVNGRSPVLAETWEIDGNRLVDETRTALRGIVRGQTARAGRLLGPLGVRFIVVPVVDGAESTRDRPIAAPTGLADALARQLDLRRRYSSPDLVVYENAAWIPVRSELGESGADASREAGAAAIIATEVTGALPLPVPERPDGTVTVGVGEGTVHLAVPYTRDWTLSVDGETVEARPAFGLTNAWDVPSGGTAELAWAVDPLHRALVSVQALAWLLVFVLATRRRRFGASGDPTGVAPVSLGDAALHMDGAGRP